MIVSIKTGARQLRFVENYSRSRGFVNSSINNWQRNLGVSPGGGVNTLMMRATLMSFLPFQGSPAYAGFPPLVRREKYGDLPPVTQKTLQGLPLA